MNIEPQRTFIRFTSADTMNTVLGAFMLFPEYIDRFAPELRSDMFPSKNHKAIFDMIVAMNSDSMVVNIETVAREFEKRYKHDTISELLSALIVCADGYPAAPVDNVKYIAQSIKELEQSQRADKLRESISRYEPTTNTPDSTKDPQKYTEAVIIAAEASRFPHLSTEKKTIKEHARELIESLRTQTEAGGGITGYRTGLEELDIMLGGLCSERLIVIAGRPGHGKTSFALQACDYTVKHEGKRVLFISLEMSAGQLMHRIASQRTQVDSNWTQDNPIDDNIAEEFTEEVGNLGFSKWIIDDNPGRTWDEIKATIAMHFYQNDGEIDMICLDYLQCIRTDYRTPRHLGLGRVTGDCAEMAKETSYGVPFILISQLNRNMDEGTPRLQHLKESGSIEQDAAQVIFIYRPEIDKENGRRYMTQLRVPKNRFGRTGIVYANMTLTTQSFGQADKEEWES